MATLGISKVSQSSINPHFAVVQQSGRVILLVAPLYSFEVFHHLRPEYCAPRPRVVGPVSP
jgi:hypothetical protein